MRLGRLPQPTGDIRNDALRELRWAMGGAGLTIEKLRVMQSVLRLPVVERAVAVARQEEAPRAALDAVVAAARELGNGMHAKVVRTALAIDYDGDAKDLTARRLAFIRYHNDATRQSGSRNFVAESPRALYAIEQQMLESLVTALGCPGAPIRASGAPMSADSSQPPVSPLPTTPPAPDMVRGAERTAAERDGRTARPPLPRQLPPATGLFCGRAEELTWLDARLDEVARATGPVILGIDGAPGVGKTALALYWAHRVMGGFLDGQLYAGLRGHARGVEPADPAAVLLRFLHALGIAPDGLPPDVDGLVGAYRSATAGRRLLVVLDDAATADQVRPLVPADPACLVVVTSRTSLSGLAVSNGARLLTLEPLPPDEAAELVSAVVGDRCAADPAATAELAARCAYLPLALRVVAAKLESEPRTTVALMTTRLRRDDRLDVLRLVGEHDLEVRAAFDLSYDSLPADAQRAFRYLSLVPGPHVTADAASAVLDVDLTSADDLLDRLATSHLMDRVGAGRFAFHDLLREYAAELCESTDEGLALRDAVRRLLGHYVVATGEAVTVLNPLATRHPVELSRCVHRHDASGDRESATEWLRAEQANLVAAVSHANAHAFDVEACALADALRGYFVVRPLERDWVAVATAAVAAARRADDDSWLCAALASLGQVRRRLGDLAAAAAHLGDAVEAGRAAGWLAGESLAHCALGAVQQDRGRLADATAHLKAGLECQRRLHGPRAGRDQLSSLAFVLYESGAFGEAARYAEEAVELFAEVDDERGMAIALDNLGSIHYELGRVDEAVAEVGSALASYQRLNLAELEVSCRAVMARIHVDLDDTGAARRDAEEALRLARESKVVRGEAVAANALGEVSRRTGDLRNAKTWYREALRLARDVGYHYACVEALVGLADTAIASGDVETGLELLSEALTAARVDGFRALEARALTSSAVASVATGDRDAALTAAQEALRIYRDGECRRGERDAEAFLESLTP